MTEPQNEKPATVTGTQFLGIGLTWVGSTVLFLWLGSLVDGWVGTDQVFTVVGAGVGIVAGFYYVYRQVTAGQRSKSTSRKTDTKE